MTSRWRWAPGAAGCSSPSKTPVPSLAPQLLISKVPRMPSGTSPYAAQFGLTMSSFQLLLHVPLLLRVTLDPPMGSWLFPDMSALS